MSNPLDDRRERSHGQPVSGELLDAGPRGPAEVIGPPSSPVDEARELLPALLRLTAGASIRSTVWGVEAAVKVGTRVVRVLVPHEAIELIEDLGSVVRTSAREVLGIDELDRRLSESMASDHAAGREQTESLRARGAELLRESADVEADDGVHPAYARILTELAPDEARILRLLARGGPQPVIDVRASNLIGVGSQLVARNLNMIGTEAGARHPGRVPVYLNNLDRLGLICFSDQSLDDPGRYQVLEAQPQAMDAIKRAGRARTVQRTVRMTEFGKDFCDACLPVDQQIV
jgi:Abortive infection alpha